MNASDLMDGSPIVVTSTSDVEAAGQLLHDHDVRILPVVDDLQNMRLMGVISDIHVGVRCRAKHHAAHCTVARHLSADPSLTVHVGDSAEDVLELMDKTRMRRLPVVDDRQRVIGVISERDVVRSLQAGDSSLRAACTGLPLI